MLLEKVTLIVISIDIEARNNRFIVVGAIETSETVIMVGAHTLENAHFNDARIRRQYLDKETK